VGWGSTRSGEQWVVGCAQWARARLAAVSSGWWAVRSAQRGGARKPPTKGFFLFERRYFLLNNKAVTRLVSSPSLAVLHLSTYLPTRWRDTESVESEDESGCSHNM